MPLALDPNQTFKIILSSDMDKPEDQRPAFIFRYATGRQWRILATAHDTLEDCKTGDEVLDQTFDAIRLTLVDWENMQGPAGLIDFDPKKLEDVLGILEAQELLLKVVSQVPDFEDKKKLDSPSASDTESSASDARES